MSKKTIQELLEFSIINIDKSSGPTSFTVSQFVKKTLKLKKTAHLGTLDPQVSGVLPVALNRACRLNEFLMHRDKTYVGIMRLHSPVLKKDLEEAIESFIGKIEQLPPVRSRVKRALREREIKTFKILEISEDKKSVVFETQVQAGTYIRKLIHNLGEKLSCGAHMLELRRTKAGVFSEDNSVNLYDFESALEDEEKLRKILISASDVLKQVLPVIQVNPKDLQKILIGKPLSQSDIVNIEDFNKLEEGEHFILFHKDIVAKSDFVLN
jgi:H/ACA ribonucleoprotein complex subunit 4